MKKFVLLVSCAIIQTLSPMVRAYEYDPETESFASHYSDDYEDLYIHAKVHAEKPVWVVDLEATEALAEFLDTEYALPGLCYDLDGECVLSGTTVLWDDARWKKFAQLLLADASCKGALRLIAAKHGAQNALAKQAKYDFFADVMRNCVECDVQTVQSIRRSVVRECSRYADAAHE